MTLKTIAEQVEGITQRGEMVPGGYTFDPRADPPLFKTPDSDRKGGVAEQAQGGSQTGANVEDLPS